MGKQHSKVRALHSRPPSVASSSSSVNSRAPDPDLSVRRSILIGLLLGIITVAAYWRVLDCRFLESYDDYFYITGNPAIAYGINSEGLRWAFTTFHAANWHPLTWISHMIDYRFFNLDPMGYHLVNLVLHIANTILLFVVLRRMTRATWKSGFVAALFAVHPLHVESVAWVSERKDVLSTFFWMLTMLCYVRYIKQRSVGRYALVAVSYALGLLAKPMLVSLPLVLLILDYWPLDRMSMKWKLVWEKVPLMALAGASCVITVIAQRAGGAMSGLDIVPIELRIWNAGISYLAYIEKMLWPSNLSVFYPYPLHHLRSWEGVGAIALLAILSVLAVKVGRKHGYVAAGWLWYIVTLLPVIGLVQVGAQSMADRYTYIPLTGLFIIAAWGIPDLLAKREKSTKKRGAGAEAEKQPPAWVGVCAAGLVLALAMSTASQVRFWKDTDTLFRHAIKVDPSNFLAYGMIGKMLTDQGDYQGAIEYLSKSLELHGSDPRVHTNIATALIKTGKIEEGFEHLRTAQQYGLDLPELHQNFAFGYFRLHQFDLAEKECRQALKLDPRFGPSRNTLGAVLASQGRLDEAIGEWKIAAEENPAYPDPHMNMALAYCNTGDFASAWDEFHTYKKLGGKANPGFAEELSMRMPEPR